MFTIEQVQSALDVELLGQHRGSAVSFDSVINDSRVSGPGQLFVALKTEVRDGHDFIPQAVANGVAGVIVHRDDILLPEGVWAFLVRDTRYAIGELAKFWRVHQPARSIVVAGNVGKTTTKELTAAVLAKKYNVLKSPMNFNDEIGLSMTLFELTEAHEKAVLEVGMFELGEIRRLCDIARPHSAIVLNVGPTHLERLGTMENIAKAKAEAVESLPSDGNAILNVDDPYVAAMASKTRAKVLSFGIQNHAEVRASNIRSKGLGGVDFRLTCGGREVEAHSPLPGERLVYNALAAVAAAFAEGMSVEEAAFALSTAEVPLRVKVIPGIHGSTILDDSYNASPASMLAALGVLAEMPGRRIALLGDMLELGNAEVEGHRQVGEAAAGIVNALLTVGPRGPMIAEAAQRAGARFVRHFDSKTEVVEFLQQSLDFGDMLLVKASHGLALNTVVDELKLDEHAANG